MKSDISQRIDDIKEFFIIQTNDLKSQLRSMNETLVMLVNEQRENNLKIKNYEKEILNLKKNRTIEILKRNIVLVIFLYIFATYVLISLYDIAGLSDIINFFISKLLK